MIDVVQTQARLSRRQVLLGLAALGLVPAVAGCEQLIEDIAEAIRNRPVRRNVANLDPDDDIIRIYIDAVEQMKALPGTDPRSWEAQANIHLNRCPHANWLFLAWHRHYIYWFERIVRDLTGEPGWALPYWNWIESPDIPDVFHSGTLAASRARTTAVVGATTADAAMSPTSFVSFGSGAITAGAAQRASSTKSVFESSVHDSVHSQIGGVLGTFSSPLDPLFWLHHNMIDYMWVEWNIGRGNHNPSESAWTDRSFNSDFVDGAGDPVIGTTSQVNFSLLLPLLSYRFENSHVGTVVGTV